MKSKFLFLVLMCSCLVLASNEKSRAIRKSYQYQEAISNGAVATLRIMVADDEGRAVQNASALAYFDMVTSTEKSEAETDANGVCKLENITRGNNITIHITKKGYYPSSRELCLASMTLPHRVSAGKWLPDPIEEKIVLRKMHPCGNFVNFGAVLTVPVTNQWIGFDLKKKSFAEHGDITFQSDIDFLVEWDGLPPSKSKLCKLKMRFPGQDSGGYYASLIFESSFPYSYQANKDARFDIKNLEIVNRDGDPYKSKINFREGCELVARSRCVRDATGKLIAANYCSIRGLRVSPNWNSNPTIRFVYAFNPTINDANLEVEAR